MLTALGIIRAVSAALARSCDGRTAISLGNSRNLSGTGAGPKIFRNRSGQSSRLMMGDKVYLKMSPKRGNSCIVRRLRPVD